MTDEQKESWKRGTLEDAEKALKLREDIRDLSENGACSRSFFKQLDHYLKPEYENLEYELNNNGCCNLLSDIDDELERYGENYKLERIAKKIRRGDYGDWCAEN